MWRWDQGRLLYFQFDILKRIADVLVKFDGVRIDDCEHLFRSALELEVGMPFLPRGYAVLRNYKRVFECAFLATVLNKRLFVSDFCKELSKKNGIFSSSDDFFLSYISRFHYPFPAFEGYDSKQERVYPFCAIIKYLCSLHQRGVPANVSLEEIFHVIIANHCTGFEDLNFYRHLAPQEFQVDETSKRQLREMIIFISQLSLLKVYNGKLWLDIIEPSTMPELVDNCLTPVGSLPRESRFEEFSELTRISGELDLPVVEMLKPNKYDAEFIEGKRKRVEHFRIDRSPLLRQYYREQNQQPICAMCKMDVLHKYPWTDYLLDIHHLLPLSSSIAITKNGTSLEDIVGLCPTCHHSVHIYYSKWLNKNEQDDFSSAAQAMQVYIDAVKEMS